MDTKTPWNNHTNKDVDTGQYQDVGQRSSSIDQSISRAETQREAVGYYPSDFGGHLLHPQHESHQKSDISNEDMISGKQRKLSAFDLYGVKSGPRKPKTPYVPEMHKKSVSGEDIVFFGDSLTTELRGTSRSSLDQRSLRRGSVRTLPFAGHNKRRSSVSASPAQDTRVQGFQEHKENVSEQPRLDKPSDETASKHNEPDTTRRTSLANMAAGVATGVAGVAVGAVGAASGAAAALFGAGQKNNAKDQTAKLTPHEKYAMPSAWPEAPKKELASSGLQDDSNDFKDEPAIHGQEPSYSEKDKFCNERTQDEDHPFCSHVKEPEICDQAPTFYCGNECKDLDGHSEHDAIQNKRITGQDNIASTHTASDQFAVDQQDTANAAGTFAIAGMGIGAGVGAGAGTDVGDGGATAAWKEYSERHANNEISDELSTHSKIDSEEDIENPIDNVHITGNDLSSPKSKYVNRDPTSANTFNTFGGLGDSSGIDSKAITNNDVTVPGSASYADDKVADSTGNGLTATTAGAGIGAGIGAGAGIAALAANRNSANAHTLDTSSNDISNDREALSPQSPNDKSFDSTEMQASGLSPSDTFGDTTAGLTPGTTDNIVATDDTTDNSTGMTPRTTDMISSDDGYTTGDALRASDDLARNSATGGTPGATDVVSHDEMGGMNDDLSPRSTSANRDIGSNTSGLAAGGLAAAAGGFAANRLASGHRDTTGYSPEVSENASGTPNDTMRSPSGFTSEVSENAGGTPNDMDSSVLGARSTGDNIDPILTSSNLDATPVSNTNNLTDSATPRTHDDMAAPKRVPTSATSTDSKRRESSEHNHKGLFTGLAGAATGLGYAHHRQHQSNQDLDPNTAKQTNYSLEREHANNVDDVYRTNARNMDQNVVTAQHPDVMTDSNDINNVYRTSAQGEQQNMLTPDNAATTTATKPNDINQVYQTTAQSASSNEAIDRPPNNIESVYRTTPTSVTPQGNRTPAGSNTPMNLSRDQMNDTSHAPHAQEHRKGSGSPVDKRRISRKEKGVLGSAVASTVGGIFGFGKSRRKSAPDHTPTDRTTSGPVLNKSGEHPAGFRSLNKPDSSRLGTNTLANNGNLLNKPNQESHTPTGATANSTESLSSTRAITGDNGPLRSTEVKDRTHGGNFHNVTDSTDASYRDHHYHKKDDAHKRNSLTQGIKDKAAHVFRRKSHSYDEPTKERRLSDAEAFKKQTLQHDTSLGATHAGPTSMSAGPTSMSASPTSMSAGPTSMSASPTSMSASPTSMSAGPTTAGNSLDNHHQFACMPNMEKLKPTGTADMGGPAQDNFVKNTDETPGFSPPPAQQVNPPTKGSYRSGQMERRRGSIQKTIGKIFHNEVMQDKGALAEISGQAKINAYNAIHPST